MCAVNRAAGQLPQHGGLLHAAAMLGYRTVRHSNAAVPAGGALESLSGGGGGQIGGCGSEPRLGKHAWHVRSHATSFHRLQTSAMMHLR